MRRILVKRKVEKTFTDEKSTIYICQARTCRSKGSEAVLAEIEELVDILGTATTNCDVKTAGCMGYCSQGPAVAITKPHPTKEKKLSTYFHVGIKTIEKSADVVYRATGKKPMTTNNADGNDSAAQPSLSPEKRLRLERMRSRRARDHAISAYKWNKALYGLIPRHAAMHDIDVCDNILAKAGYYATTASHDANLIPWSPHATSMPTAIEKYVKWTLHAISILSPHSAIFKFTTTNRKRGTPHPRGSGSRAKPITWHTTMLGHVGRNPEGPLPWIERDYTPISSALEWERGRCDILIKLYNDGRLTSWLKNDVVEPFRKRGVRGVDDDDDDDDDDDEAMTVWLSQPLKTLSVPYLISDDDSSSSSSSGASFRPASVLLLLAGTGVVALPQIMAHQDPLRKLGVGTPKNSQLLCPIDVILSCREDDLLILPETKRWCDEGREGRLGTAGGSKYKNRGVRRLTLLVTEGGSSTKKDDDGVGSPPPLYEFSKKSSTATTDHQSDCVSLEKVSEYARVLKSQRLSANLVEEAMNNMVEPCRVIVSGPDSFNKAAREFLTEVGATPEQITVLSA